MKKNKKIIENKIESLNDYVNKIKQLKDGISLVIGTTNSGMSTTQYLKDKNINIGEI